VPRKRGYSDKDISHAVKKAYSFRQVLQKLGLKEAGGNYWLIQKNVQRLNLDTTHFRGKAWRRGLKKAVEHNP